LRVGGIDRGLEEWCLFIIKENMAYVYTHTRLDTNQIFYIGIGSDNSYARASSLRGRNVWWYRVIAKADYKVDILYDNLTWNEACKKEIEIIKQIGRKQDGGTLVNLTEGGDGFRSNHTQETKDRIRDFYKGKTYEELYGDRAEAEKLKRKKATRTPEQYKEAAKKCSETTRGVSKQFKNVECPHCNAQGGVNVMYRWHFDKCKLK